jgi:hypothetical protein
MRGKKGLRSIPRQPSELGVIGAFDGLAIHLPAFNRQKNFWRLWTNGGYTEGRNIVIEYRVAEGETNGK